MEMLANAQRWLHAVVASHEEVVLENGLKQRSIHGFELKTCALWSGMHATECCIFIDVIIELKIAHYFFQTAHFFPNKFHLLVSRLAYPPVLAIQVKLVCFQLNWHVSATTVTVKPIQNRPIGQSNYLIWDNSCSHWAEVGKSALPNLTKDFQVWIHLMTKANHNKSMILISLLSSIYLFFLTIQIDLEFGGNEWLIALNSRGVWERWNDSTMIMNDNNENT